MRFLVMARLLADCNPTAAGSQGPTSTCQATDNHMEGGYHEIANIRLRFRRDGLARSES